MIKKNIKQKLDNMNPIKEYKALDNFNIDGFYNNENSFVSTKKLIREDIDLPTDRFFKDFNYEEYSKKIIREYTPWESYLNSAKNGIDFSHDSENTRLDSKIKILNSKEKEKKKGTIGLILAIITAILFKSGAITKLFSLLVHGLFFLGKFKWVMVAFGSMLLSIIVYAMTYNIKFAIGLVFLIFVHEMGHALMMVASGYNLSLPVFIPFFGAAIIMKQMPKDAFVEAKIALGGPILGTLAAISMLSGYFLTHDIFFIYMANIGFMLNLFNLTPVVPLDGGRIVSAISKIIWIPAIIILLGLTIIFKTPVLVLIIIFAFLSLFSKGKNINSDYYNVPLHIKFLLTISYFSLVIFLAFATYTSYNYITYFSNP